MGPSRLSSEDLSRFSRLVGRKWKLTGFFFFFLHPGVQSRTIILIQIKSLCPRRSYSLTCPSVPQNQFNILVLPVQCRVNVASYREISVKITGVLRLETLHAVSFKVPPALDVLPRSRRGDGDMAVKPAFVCFSPPFQLKFKIMDLISSASVELPSSSPMFLHEERPVRHVSQRWLQSKQHHYLTALRAAAPINLINFRKASVKHS